jgi:transcriptional regulator GlxA family with amidase domain
MVLFDQVQSLDVTGPLEVFTGANTWRGGRGDGPAYEIRTASLGGRPVRTSSGLRITPDEDLREVRLRRPGLLIVPGGRGSRHPDPELTGWLRAHGRQADRLVSVCTGAFLLAEAGLLDGRRVTTHWAYCGSLAARYPRISVEGSRSSSGTGTSPPLRASPLASTSRSPWWKTTWGGTWPWTSPGSW